MLRLLVMTLASTASLQVLITGMFLVLHAKFSYWAPLTSLEVCWGSLSFAHMFAFLFFLLHLSVLDWMAKKKATEDELGDLRDLDYDKTVTTPP